MHGMDLFKESQSLEMFVPQANTQQKAHNEEKAP